jgi:hypothetical protein
VTSNDFAPYLKAVSSSLAKFEQNHPQAQGTCDAGPLVGSSDKLADGGGGGGASIVDLTCLQHVPDVFRSKHFDLKSPSTFAAVFGCPADLDSAGGGYDDDGDALLEQLHSHLDDVEAALMLGVRSRSSEFFAAVDELQLLSLDIASALQDTADRALPLYEDCLEKSKRILGDDHPSTLELINNLARLLQAQGTADRALPLFEDCLEKRKRILGDDHPPHTHINPKSCSFTQALELS